MISLIVTIIVGAISGWLAGIIMKSSHGIIVNILLGVFGGAIAGAILGVFHINLGGLGGNIICGIIGACLLIYIGKLIKK